MNNQNIFRGQVKIADVEVQFNKLIDSINTAIRAFNDAVALTGTIDFNKGSSVLSPKGYALSIGGLKTILKAYSGIRIGTDVYKVNNNTLIVTDGIYFKPNFVNELPDIIRLPYGVINDVSLGSKQALYYCQDTGEYRIFNDTVDDEDVEVEGENYSFICPLNLNRDIRYCDTRNFELENVPNLHIYTGDNTIGGYTTNQTIDTSKGAKFEGYVGTAAGRNTSSSASLFNVRVSHHVRGGGRDATCWCSIPYLWIPKGLPSLYHLSGTSESTKHRVSDCIFSWEDVTKT